ncbi:hypothetical protein HELRODRAFT_159814 [Helobdella robusta]|uniref:Nudix hydrolase domain-containing protein n=1 Tax=Helobdella robusta TaxID=6412 RepID=T1EPF5_HELRO|nr:hypothetical protein HELRODRAFT_159814 [Helobdella robusta]ESO13183.1 hypothetical protein HELRODRAFT_159814 [Helobdella robusta]
MDEVLLSILQRSACDREVIVDLHHDDKSFVPLVKKNIAYIVAGAIFNENDEILLMQEAKQSCYGKWYIPAGRMEANETIEDAVRREVLEETGIMCSPSSLSYVEVSNKWYRFSMICDLAGGNLKKTADKESLQADWFSVSSVLRKEVDLRHTDILRMIELAYKQHKNADFIAMRPINIPHSRVIMRLFLVHHNEQSRKYNFLMGKKPENHLPSFEMLSCRENYYKLLKKIFGTGKTSVKVRTVLTVEHNGKPRHRNDGLVITVLAVVTPKEIYNVRASEFEWIPIENSNIADSVSKFLNGDSVMLDFL